MDTPLLYSGCIDRLDDQFVHVHVDTENGLQLWSIPRQRLDAEQEPYAEPGDPIDIHESSDLLHFHVRCRRIDHQNLTVKERAQLRAEGALS